MMVVYVYRQRHRYIVNLSAIIDYSELCLCKTLYNKNNHQRAYTYVYIQFCLEYLLKYLKQYKYILYIDGSLQNKKATSCTSEQTYKKKPSYEQKETKYYYVVYLPSYMLYRKRIVKLRRLRLYGLYPLLYRIYVQHKIGAIYYKQGPSWRVTQSYHVHICMFIINDMELGTLLPQL